MATIKKYDLNSWNGADYELFYASYYLPRLFPVNTDNIIESIIEYFKDNHYNVICSVKSKLTPYIVKLYMGWGAHYATKHELLVKLAVETIKSCTKINHFIMIRPMLKMIKPTKLEILSAHKMNNLSSECLVEVFRYFKIDLSDTIHPVVFNPFWTPISQLSSTNREAYWMLQYFKLPSDYKQCMKKFGRAYFKMATNYKLDSTSFEKSPYFFEAKKVIKALVIRSRFYLKLGKYEYGWSLDFEDTKKPFPKIEHLPEDDFNSMVLPLELFKKSKTTNPRKLTKKLMEIENTSPDETINRKRKHETKHKKKEHPKIERKRKHQDTESEPEESTETSDTQSEEEVETKKPDRKRHKIGKVRPIPGIPERDLAIVSMEDIS